MFKNKILQPSEIELALQKQFVTAQQAAWLMNRWEADRCKHDLFYLAHTILGYSDLTPLHADLCKVIESVNPLFEYLSTHQVLKVVTVSTTSTVTAETLPNPNTDMGTDMAGPASPLQSHQHSFDDKSNQVSEAEPQADSGGGGGVGESNPQTKFHKKLQNLKFQCTNISPRLANYVTFNEHSKSRLFMLFRGAFKSTLISIAHTIQLMLIYPDIRILIASHKKEGGSQPLLEAVKHHFMRNERFRALFPEYCPVPNQLGQVDWGTSERVTLPNRSGKASFPEATIEIAGSTTDVTGRHYDYIKVDDLVTRESVTNETMLAKTEEFNALLKFLFNQPEWGITDYVGTRYHFADLYGKLLEAPITKVVLPCWDSNQNPTIYERFSKDGLEAIRNDASMTAYQFSAQYLLNPIPDEEQVFRPEWFKRDGFYWTELPSQLRHYFFVDPASKRRKTSDYTALIHLGIDHRNHIYVIDMLRDKLGDSERVKMVFDILRKYGHRVVHYETIGFQDTDASNIRRHGVETGYPVSVEEVSGNKASKEDRIRGLQYLFEAGAIHFPSRYLYTSKFHKRQQDMVEDFRKEAFMFPRCEHDDMLDCLSFVLGIRTGKPTDAKPLESQDEFDRVRQLSIDMKKGKPMGSQSRWPSKFPAFRSFR